ncbi:hypothetical protein [Chitinophaga rhizosphaerae]|uniref:hypothetical protein n=1 Tax=Chitinophaga rhizosphaerae TaxID=1864947 RepID=UPI000F807A35|nr:hypothetical protein [Chitinophaga rhizosphaerae]
MLISHGTFAENGQLSFHGYDSIEELVDDFAKSVGWYSSFTAVRKLRIYKIPKQLINLHSMDVSEELPALHRKIRRTLPDHSEIGTWLPFKLIRRDPEKYFQAHFKDALVEVLRNRLSDGNV